MNRGHECFGGGVADCSDLGYADTAHPRNEIPFQSAGAAWEVIPPSTDNHTSRSLFPENGVSVTSSVYQKAMATHR
jgi:hypothetical protein